MRVPPRAASLGLVGCHGCGLVLRAPAGAAGFCPRCDTALRRRKPDSTRRCAAYLAAAAILYIPANLLPIMQTAKLFEVEDNTILSGVVVLWHDGAWDLAAIVFVASIVVPLLKIVTLALLLASVRRSSTWRRRERTRLYRLMEIIGRWSMLDVFVVALLVTLVRFGVFAQVHAGPAIIPFCSVVVLTMLATMSFDPRLIWDADAAPAEAAVPPPALARAPQAP